MRAPWLLVLLAGCGEDALPDGDGLTPASELTIVAHQDDDLLFMQPDLLDAVQRKTGVTNIYVTAGNGTGGTSEANRRYAGLRAAYSEATGERDWECVWIQLAEHDAQHCRLAAANLSLVFLGYPDGGKEGEYPTSLRHLWDGEITSAVTVADRPVRYDRDGLVAALAAAIDATQPRTLRTLDLAGTHGRDHSDHVLAGALAWLAVAASQHAPEVIAYRGYATELEPPTLIPPLYERSREVLGRYEACADKHARCGSFRAPSVDHEVWLQRRYAIASRAASGQLRTGDRCVRIATDATLSLGSCTGADPWDLAGQTLRSGTRCLERRGSGLVAGTTCERALLDDDGHLWLGTPPEIARGGHLSCLTPSKDLVVAGRCGPDGAASWELAPTATIIARPSGIVGTGRAVRLGDVDGDHRADLCAVVANRLRCAIGDGTGRFRAARPLGAAFAVEPESLALGDLDGDSRADACGRDAGGILCLVAATGFAADRFTVAFARTGPADASDRSLALVDADGDHLAEICGLGAAGVTCVSRTGDLPRSPWPAPTSLVWPGDLDGDGLADWCNATPAGNACGLAAHADLTTDGVPWSFALGGTVEPAPDSAATSALGDIDGDGRADLCSLRERRVVCAHSQARGFGPAATRAILTRDPTALWLGDLDGNGTADVCVDHGSSISCAR